MNTDPKKFLFPFGPVLILTLIGLMLLSAVLYYRAINVQRFMEPALAVTQPRIEFAQNIRNLLSKEFGEKESEEIKFAMGSVFVEESLLFDRKTVTVRPRILNRLGRVFLAALKDPEMRAHIDLIIVSTKFPLSPDAKSKTRAAMQHEAGLILNFMYKSAPELEKDYGVYFIATAMPVMALEEETHWIEFRLIPTELIHIELLQRLHKYVR